MHWRKQLTLINDALIKSNLVKLNIITDLNGYLVKNSILVKNLNQFLPFVSVEYIDDVYCKIMEDTGESNTDLSNKRKIMKIINKLEIKLPVKISSY